MVIHQHMDPMDPLRSEHSASKSRELFDRTKPRQWRLEQGEEIQEKSLKESSLSWRDGNSIDGNEKSPSIWMDASIMEAMSNESCCNDVVPRGRFMEAFRSARGGFSACSKATVADGQDFVVVFMIWFGL